MKDLKLIFQPNGISCGNTVLKMVANYLNIGLDISIEKLIEVMETDSLTGTTDLKMIKGLEYLNIPYIQNKHHDNIMTDEIQIEVLKSILEKENVFIMRTKTKGVFHWILVHKFNGVKFQVLDPWLGKIEYTPEEILDIWSVRNYDGFTI